MDVIRKIREHIREHDGGVKGVDVKLYDVPHDVVVYHVPRLVDAIDLSARATSAGRIDPDGPAADGARPPRNRATN